MKVRYSPQAAADLAAIADYLTERSTSGAIAVERALRTTIALIADFPGSGRQVEQRAGVRVIPVTRYPYLIFYTVADNALVVLHVRHASRRPAGPGDF
jgi:addiction module RelE/StbE family toxin